ncbi:MAG TPA: ribulose-phosphate 3-epimerase [Terriglobia bacterium]|nr:ribulose-phosphate 3-epimerase [Terriglobia bacterium]
MALIVPYLLAANFARLGEQVELMRSADATRLHLDVCDGHFAPGITAGLPVIARLRKATDLALDVHLRVERPERFIEDFAGAGVDSITVHPESTADFHRVLRQIRSNGILTGAALNPATPVSAISEVAEDLDFLSLLSAGAGEQPYFQRTLQRVSAAVRLRRERGGRFILQIEGDVDAEQVEALVGAGAGMVVLGAAIFAHSNPEGRLKHLMRSASQAGEKITSRGSCHCE